MIDSMDYKRNSFEDVTVEDVKRLLDSGRISRNHAKGMLLEIVCYRTLVDMGIYPIPLHNPFDEDYVRDQHLSVDMIFRHYGRTWAIECKNFNHNAINWMDEEWVKKEVVKRFEYLEKTVPVDYKVLVISYMPKNIPDYIIELVTHREANFTNYSTLHLLLNNLFLSLFHQIKQKNTLYSIQGYVRNTAKGEYVKLKRIDRKLREKQIEGWVNDSS